MRFILLFIIFLFSFHYIYSQDLEKENTFNKFNKKKFNTLILAKTTSFTSTIILLDQLWYKNYPRESFHFTNDNKSWMFMDKLGHATTSYYLGLAAIESYNWTGIENNKAIWFGGLSGLLFLSAIETLDGFSKEWGASIGDVIANSFGSFLLIGQELLWSEQKIQLKFSYFPTKWARENPSQLGSKHIERILKDYNGQTYWITFNFNSILSLKENKLPSWLGFSLGYGASGMTSPNFDNTQNRNKHYYMSFDIDLNRINVKNKFLKSILTTFGFIKFPMPTIELSNKTFLFHPVFF